MKKRVLLFDLDGTLTDSAEGIFHSVIYALEQFGIAVEDESALRAFVGPPLLASSQKHSGFDREQAQKAVEHYRVYFAERGLLENQVYDGVREVLRELNRRGFVLMVATSKPEVFAKRILEHFDLAGEFAFIGAATLDESRSRKDAVIRYVLEENQLTDLSQVVMVGDRDQDILGAKKNGLESIGVLYGYGSLEELTQAGADALAETPQALLDIVEAWE